MPRRRAATRRAPGSPEGAEQAPLLIGKDGSIVLPAPGQGDAATRRAAAPGDGCRRGRWQRQAGQLHPAQAARRHRDHEPPRAEHRLQADPVRTGLGARGRELAGHRAAPRGGEDHGEAHLPSAARRAHRMRGHAAVPDGAVRLPQSGPAGQGRWSRRSTSVSTCRARRWCRPFPRHPPAHRRRCAPIRLDNSVQCANARVSGGPLPPGCAIRRQRHAPLPAPSGSSWVPASDQF